MTKPEKRHRLSDLTTLPDASELLGLQRNTLNVYASRKLYDDFPEPVHTFGAVSIYERRTLLAWASVRGIGKATYPTP
jgi:predicted DNA-binding transcriptional regulator AlpA